MELLMVKKEIELNQKILRPFGNLTYGTSPIAKIS
jgi:hypothetical protein